MAKEKKISVTFNHMINRNHLEYPNFILCRVVYNRKATNFNMRLVNGGTRCSDEDYELYYKDKSERFEYFETWISNVIRKEVKSVKEKFTLKGLSSRIDVHYARGIRYWVLEIPVFDDILNSLEDVLTHKKYVQLEERENSLLQDDLSIGFQAIDRLDFLVNKLDIPLNSFPEDLLERINLLVNFILFDYQSSFDKLKFPYKDIMGFIDIGDWIGNDFYKNSFIDFLKKRKILLPNKAMYLSEFIVNNFPKTDVDPYHYLKSIDDSIYKFKLESIEELKEQNLLLDSLNKLAKKERNRIEKRNESK